MAPSPARLVIAYTGAFLSGAVAAYVLLRLMAAALFTGPELDAPLLLTLAAPLAGAAVFQLVFGIVTGLGRGAAFWPVALAVVYLLLALALGATLLGLVTPLEAAILYLASVYSIGLWAALIARSRVAEAGP